MSRFLGPIHYWLFNKIQKFEELEQNLNSGFTEKFGPKVPEIIQTKNTQYGQPVLGQALEEIIDPGNIHGWLQGKIKNAETRQAAILTEVFNQFGGEAVTLAKDIYTIHGQQCGREAKNSKPVSTAPELYRALNDFILDGMPCDSINRLTVEDTDRVEWEHEECLHAGYWRDAKADPHTFYHLRQTWVENFITSANPNFRYTLNRNGKFHHMIKKSV